MARYNYSMKRRDKKLAGVCSTIGEVFNLDPTFIRVGFVAAAVLISWKLALIAYVGAGIYLAIQRNRANARHHALTEKRGRCALARSSRRCR